MSGCVILLAPDIGPNRWLGRLVQFIDGQLRTRIVGPRLLLHPDFAAECDAALGYVPVFDSKALSLTYRDEAGAVWHRMRCG